MTNYTINSLCEELNFSNEHGFCNTYIDNVLFFRASQHEASCPLKYDPGLFFILQGHKVGSVNGRHFKNGQGRFLMLTNSYPIQCETFASNDEPLLGLYVKFDMTELHRQAKIIEETDGKIGKQSKDEQAVVPSKMTPSIESALNYLIEVLHGSISSRVLESACLSRLYFTVLTSPTGYVLHSLSKTETNLSKVSSAMQYMEENLNLKLSVEDIASKVNLSQPSFYRIFKQITGESPLQYLKKLRLNKAKSLIIYQKKPAYIAAIDVGYDSPNQFSREFKRYFGVPPKQADKLPYSTLVGVN